MGQSRENCANHQTGESIMGARLMNAKKKARRRRHKKKATDSATGSTSQGAADRDRNSAPRPRVGGRES
jgi:hypothetical protein